MVIFGEMAGTSLAGPNGVFTLPDTEIDTETNKNWLIRDCVKVFIETDDNTGVLFPSVSFSGSVNSALLVGSFPQEWGYALPVPVY